MKLFREIKIEYVTRPQMKAVVVSSRTAARILRKVWDKNIAHEESTYCLFINVAAKINGWAKIGSGSWNGTIIDPRKILSIALACNATSIVVAHNHPSGNVLPSQRDIEATKELKAAAQIVGISLIDHIVLGPAQRPNYYSFADENML